MTADAPAAIDALFDGSIQSLWETDPVGRVEAASRSWLRYTGQDAGEAVGHGWLAAVHPDDRARAECEWRAGIATRRAIDADFRLHDPRGRYRWTNVRAAPVLGADGTLTGWLVMTMDIDRRKRAELALIESEARLASSETRLQRFGDASHSVLWMRDPDTLASLYLTPAFERIYGLPREAVTGLDGVERWFELVVEEDRPRMRDALRRIRAGEELTLDFRIRRPDGTIRWLRNTDFAVRGADGRIEAIGGIGEDITAAKDAEQRLRSSEERLRLALETGRLGAWDWDIVAQTVSWSDEHFLLEGYAVGEVRPSYEAWVERVHPDDRARVEAAMAAAMAGGPPYQEVFRSVHPDGTILWLSATGKFFRDAAGAPIRMIGVMYDVTAQYEWQGQLQLMVGELQHRTRNLIGVVRSILDRTLRDSASLVDFRGKVGHRLAALARVQGLLSRLNDGDRITFDEIVDSEFAAHDIADDPRVSLAGPAGVRLRSSSVQTLALAVHELATNAAKHGALTVPDGRLALSWRLEAQGAGEQPWLHVVWRESGMALAPDAALRRGQGRDLIERGLPFQLNAVADFTVAADGVVWRISLPVSPTNADTRNDDGRA